MLPQPREESSSVAQWQSPDKVGINRLPLAARATVRKVYARPSGEIRNTFQRSSVVERSAVNRLVVGSNPTAGANLGFDELLGVHPAKPAWPFLHRPDLNERVASHNRRDKFAGKYTRKNGPWSLVWSEAHRTRAAAMTREREIKSWKSARLVQIRLLDLKTQLSGRVPIKSGLTDWS